MAVYLNNTEIFRRNLSGGAAYGSYATAPNTAQLRTWFSYPVPAALLRAGTNILAVDDYYFVLSENKFFLHRADRNEWTIVPDRALRNHHSQLVFGSDYYNLFMDVLINGPMFLFSTARFPVIS